MRSNITGQLMAALLGIISALLIFQSCDEREMDRVSSFAAAFSPLLVGEIEDYINSPQLKDALGSEGQDLARLAAVYLLPRLANKAGELAGDLGPVELGYKYIMEADPVLARMIYREDEYGLALGLAPRLDAWLHDKGYLGKATLYERLNAGALRLELTDADEAELVEAAARAIIEEYYAVKYGEQLEPGAEMDPTDRLLDDGLTVEGEW